MLTLLPLALASAIAPPIAAEPCAATEAGRILPSDVQPAAQCVLSPDGRKRVVVISGHISVRNGAESWSAGIIDYGQVVWNPTSTGFVVADNAGSGQSSYFSYVDLEHRALGRIKALRWSAAKLYAKRSRCSGPNSYVFSWFVGWQDPRHVRLVVQEGVHSEGCRPDDPGAAELGVIGDPVTGRIVRVLTQAEYQREWCSPAERAEYGVCHAPDPIVPAP